MHCNSTTIFDMMNELTANYVGAAVFSMIGIVDLKKRGEGKLKCLKFFLKMYIIV